MDQDKLNERILSALTDIKATLTGHDTWRTKTQDDFETYKARDENWKKWVLRSMMIIAGFTLLSILKLYGFWDEFLDLAADAGKVIP